MQDLETALAEQTPSTLENSGVYDLPTLTLDGIPTPIDKMTQVCSEICRTCTLIKSWPSSKAQWADPVVASWITNQAT